MILIRRDSVKKNREDMEEEESDYNLRGPYTFQEDEWDVDDHPIFQSSPHHTPLACCSNLRGRRTNLVQAIDEGGEPKKHKGGKGVNKSFKRKRRH